MTKTILKVLAVAALLSPAVLWVVRAQSKPTTATFISKEEIEAIDNAEQVKISQDMNIKIVDIGSEHYALGLVHRSSTRNKPANGLSSASNVVPNAGGAPPEPCGRQMSTLPPGGQTGGLTHDFQTEGYYIISGGGTMFTDGYMVNGRHAVILPNGWSCQGATAYGVKKTDVKQGDVVIIPAGVVHGWSDIPDHVDYLSFRPSQNTLEAGWVNPIIQSMKP